MSDVLTQEEKTQAMYGVANIKRLVQAIETELTKENAHKSYLKEKLTDLEWSTKEVSWGWGD